MSNKRMNEFISNNVYAWEFPSGSSGINHEGKKIKNLIKIITSSFAK